MKRLLLMLAAFAAFVLLASACGGADIEVSQSPEPDPAANDSPPTDGDSSEVGESSDDVTASEPGAIVSIIFHDGVPVQIMAQLDDGREVDIVIDPALDLEMFDRVELRPTRSGPWEVVRELSADTTAESSPTETKVEPHSPEEVTDGRITIAVVQIEPTSSFLTERGVPPASSGLVHVGIELTLRGVAQGHITNLLGFEGNQWTLRDGLGDSFGPVFGSVTGLRFTDPSDIRSPSEAVPGAVATALFEIPASATPTTLLVRYTHTSSLEAGTGELGELGVELGGL